MNNLPKHHGPGPQRRGAQCSCIGLRPALFNQGGNVAERGPLATLGAPRQHSQTILEMKVYLGLDFYIPKPQITRKK